MNIKRLLHSDIGKNIISILLGLGLATLFRKVCNDRNCIVFKAPEPSKIKDKIFKFNSKCYTYKEESESCSSKKKIVKFA
tara:strand:+ start:205 stop:444 length:240 start_codon:yes stop_codon:yes gene_type:complete